ncbi:hypothetical protein FHS42_004326 [Streptomyces zagrosensis]|uniref:Uncharacterized protein n=1 Tax=Streptomyces zagrosensis TaxID=1042984 RepID=A0A7W9UZY0_9ACTN|nr:hypothetical protein [Streptomyces zagrosensis]
MGAARLRPCLLADPVAYTGRVLLSPIEVDVAHLRFAIIARYGPVRTPVTLRPALVPPVTPRRCDLGA